MSLSTWLLFVPLTLLVSITPGPNMMLMFSLGLARGVRATLPAMLGALLVVLLMILTSTLGLAVLLAEQPHLYLALKWCGALYLCWLGLQLLRQPVETALKAAVVTHNNASFWQGVTVASSNPKAIVFAASYFPQFISSQQSALAQLAILLPTFVVLEVGCYLLYAASGKQLAAWFAKPRVLRNFNRAIGLVFIAFALALAIS